VVEDTDWTLGKLRKEGFPQVIIETMDSVTWQKYENCEDFINSFGKKSFKLTWQG
jgi:cobalamin biosynthesis Co2+ chelatase CbiK